MRQKLSYTQQLHDQGFDESSHIPFTKHYRVKCSQCEALTINGVPCHETGCPNQAAADRRAREAEREEEHQQQDEG